MFSMAVLDKVISVVSIIAFVSLILLLLTVGTSYILKTWFSGNRDQQIAVGQVLADEPQNIAPNKESWHLDRQLSVVDLTVAIIALITLPILIFQSRELQRTTNLSRSSVETSMNSERAHILFERVMVHGVKEAAQGTNPDGTIRISYVMKNYGNTPGWTLDITFKVHVSADCILPRPPDYSDRTYTEANYAILPNVPFNTFESFPIQHYRMTQQEAQEILAGAKCLYIYGYINYRDVFRVHRMSRFAYWYHFDYYQDKQGAERDFPEPVGFPDHWEYR